MTPGIHTHRTPDLPPVVEVPDLPGARVPSGDKRSRESDRARTAGENGSDRRDEPTD
ncbi:hypothetical protein SAMN05216251_120123 [Actinacidiphila alni]|uniref:Uncharacterized protein n=1 Tax=Actinacidiphila alni TaxID=380248 RepID=A0A1I2K2W8_9ACTN|nr:hypothetical protein [Actinacidiphila alni]SFF59557.1 hypothetical protein SAMN05216251_120123 [Actinacidiphila alni]